MSMPRTRTLLLALALLACGYLVGRGCAPRAGEHDHAPAPETEESVATVWTCAMHPQVRRSEPGLCPICGMDLTPVLEDTAPSAQLGALRMTPEALARAEIETTPVERRSVAREVQMVGKVAYDETRLSTIAARVPGRLDELFVDYTGLRVRAGDHLVRIYSPTLYSAQQELLQAMRTASSLGEGALELLRSTSDATVVSAREKLRLYGVTGEQVEALIERGRPEEHVTIHAPFGGVVIEKHAVEGMYVAEGAPIYKIADLSRVWILLDAYESDLDWLRYGQDVAFRVEAFPGEEFHGRIAFIDPMLDPRTRTVHVRLSVENAEARLKPDMFVSAEVRSVLTAGGDVVDADLAAKWICPMHPEVVADGPGSCPECGMELAAASELGFVADSGRATNLVVPASAPLITGKRALVYVRVPEAEQPTFEPRVIELGPRAGPWYVVERGLREGEQVVVRGNFKLDSELQIRAGPSMMSGRDAPSPGAAPRMDQGAEGRLRSATPELWHAMGEVAEAYLAVQAELFAGEDAGAPARALLERLAAVRSEAPPAEADALLERVQSAAAELVEAEGLEPRRERLASLSAVLLTALERIGYERPGGPLRLFHCPMAVGGTGADWLQAGPETANPYFGASMPRCGELLREVR